MNQLYQKTKYAILVFFALFLTVVFDIAFLPISYNRLDFVKRHTIDSINEKWENYLQTMPEDERKTVDYSKLMGTLGPVDRILTERIFAINPEELGFNGAFFSKEPISDLVKIPPQEFVLPDKKFDTGVNFLPQPVYADFHQMMTDMKKELGKQVYLNSGYRSPGYQAKLVFFYLADENEYSLKKNAQYVAMPGFSEHNTPNTALDFINEAGISGEEKGQVAEDFERLPEYEWLTKNASKYNFYISYPRGNDTGISFEPWHWHWEKKQ